MRNLRSPLHQLDMMTKKNEKSNNNVFKSAGFVSNTPIVTPATMLNNTITKTPAAAYTQVILKLTYWFVEQWFEM